LSSEIRVFGSKVVAKKHKIGIILLKIGFTLTLEPEMLETRSKAQKTQILA